MGWLGESGVFVTLRFKFVRVLQVSLLPPSFQNFKSVSISVVPVFLVSVYGYVAGVQELWGFFFSWVFQVEAVDLVQSFPFNPSGIFAFS